MMLPRSPRPPMMAFSPTVGPVVGEDQGVVPPPDPPPPLPAPPGDPGAPPTPGAPPGPKPVKPVGGGGGMPAAPTGTSCQPGCRPRSLTAANSPGSIPGDSGRTIEFRQFEEGVPDLDWLVLRLPGVGIHIGSIPAGAGKPAVSGLSREPSRVDPRGRGETASRHYQQDGYMGRSPRARGNRRDRDHRLVAHGSIPAGAGKPRGWSTRSRSRRVDPRGRGETRFPEGHQATQPGSIPAGAGKPRTTRC